jgi:hypothetical protein
MFGTSYISNTSIFPEVLFTKVKDCLDWVATDVLTTVGIRYSQMTCEEVSASRQPLLALGWAAYRPVLPGAEEKKEDERFPYSLKATQAGIDIVDEFRAAQGYVTLQEQQRINSER